MVGSFIFEKIFILNFIYFQCSFETLYYKINDSHFGPHTLVWDSLKTIFIFIQNAQRRYNIKTKKTKKQITEPL